MYAVSCATRYNLLLSLDFGEQSNDPRGGASVRPNTAASTELNAIVWI